MEDNELIRSFLSNESNAIALTGHAITITNKVLVERAEHYFNLGLEKLVTKDYNDAIKDFTRAIELNSYSSKYFFERTKVLIVRRNELKFYQFNYNPLNPNHKRKVFSFAGHPIANSILGDERQSYYYNYFRGEEPPNYDSAILADINEAIKLDSNNTSYSMDRASLWKDYYDRSCIKETNSDYHGAFLDWLQALELNPNESLAMRSTINECIRWFDWKYRK